MKTRSGTYYVLTPLPSHQREKCSRASYDYLDVKGCDAKGVLKPSQFEELMKLAKTLHNRLKDNPTITVFPSVLTLEDSDILSQLNPKDVLYVSAHGSPAAIGNKEHGVNLSPERFARALQDAKLSPQLRLLKIMACDSAIDAENIEVYGKSTRKPELKKEQPKSFSETFLNLMPKSDKNHPNYSNLDVVGYLGEVGVDVQSTKKSTQHSFVKFFDSKNTNIRAKEASIIYSAKATPSFKKLERDEKNAEKIDLLKLTNSI